MSTSGEISLRFLPTISSRVTPRRGRSVAIDRGEADRALPLAGLRVANFGWGLVGPTAGQLLAFLGAEIRVSAPVYVNDTLRVHVELVSARETARPDRGLVVTRHRVVNQRGEEVMTYSATRLILRRPAKNA